MNKWKETTKNTKEERKGKWNETMNFEYEWMANLDLPNAKVTHFLH